MSEEIEQARQSLQGERQFVEKQRQEAQEYEKILQKGKEIVSEEKKKIPLPSQRLLRQGMFAGLEGRKRRIQVESIKKGLKTEETKILGEEKRVGLIKEGLITYEKEQLDPWEGRIETEQKRQEAYNLLNELITKGQGGTPKGGDIKKIEEAFSRAELNPTEGVEIYKSELKHTLWLAEEEIAKRKNIVYSSEIKGIPTPIYGSSGQLVGIDDPIKKVSRLPTISEKAIYGKVTSFFLTPSTKTYTPPPRDLPRTDIVKDFRPMMSIDPSKVLQPKNIFDVPFRTTGSPIRITKLTSPKSRGYNETRHQVKQPAKIKPILNIQKPKKTIKKSYFGFGEDNILKKNKSKKKKSIWGF